MDQINTPYLVQYVRQFGLWAPVIAFLLFTIQAMFPVVPYVIIAAVGGILFGFKMGAFLAWVGALTGACLTYWLIKKLGYTSFLKWFYHRRGYDLRRLSPSIAFWTLVIARVIPVIPTPMINAGAALGGVSFFTFLFSSAIGKIPTAVLYTGLGLAVFNARDVKSILLILALILVLLIGGWHLARKYYNATLS
ncbi:MAG: VTT domain-containing protein [Syntrophomonadaceae bacterium]|nr:VTT domain-containing protein [Syntrophomonadaceae bacterium]